MAARKSSRVKRKYKTKSRVTNWQEYERGLRSVATITVRFSEEAREALDTTEARSPRWPAALCTSCSVRLASRTSRS